MCIFYNMENFMENEMIYFVMKFETAAESWLYSILFFKHIKP